MLKVLLPLCVGSQSRRDFELSVLDVFVTSGGPGREYALPSDRWTRRGDEAGSREQPRHLFRDACDPRVQSRVDFVTP